MKSNQLAAWSKSWPALSNVVRHSQARSAEIWLIYDTDAITLTVSDDGRGFDTSNPQSGR